MTKDQDYWKERFTQLEESAHREAEKVYEDLQEAYRAAERRIQADLSIWYQRFANNNGQISMAEARRLLTSGELKELKWNLQDYIKHGKENGISADWAKQLENASARYHITRLQAIQLELQNTVEVLYGGQLDSLDSLMKRQYLDTYYRTAYTIQQGVGIGWDVAGINRTALDRVIHKPWTTDGKNFSDRIWANKTSLISDLQKTLSQSIILGRHPQQLTKEFAARMGTDEYKAGRLLFTESAYISAVADEECFKNLGVEKFVFIATLDERTSQICQEMDGQIFDMKDYAVGVNVPPLHPWCRSVTAPYYADLAGIGQRAARDPETGKTYYVPKETTYKEWKAAFTTDPQTGETGSKEAFTPVPGRDYSCSLATKCGTAFYDALRDKVDTCGNPDLQSVWLAHESEIRVEDTAFNGGEARGTRIYIDLKSDTKGSSFEAPQAVTAHEGGHAIDSACKDRLPSTRWGDRHFSSRYQDGLFPKTITDEVMEMVNQEYARIKAEFAEHKDDTEWLRSQHRVTYWGEVLKPSKDEAYAAVQKMFLKLPDRARSDISDMLEGATSGKIRCGFGHGTSYWRKRTYDGLKDGLATEAFAEMTSAELTNPESLAVIKQYLPKSYGVYCEMLKHMK